MATLACYIDSHLPLADQILTFTELYGRPSLYVILPWHKKIYATHKLSDDCIYLTQTIRFLKWTTSIPQ